MQEITVLTAQAQVHSLLTAFHADIHGIDADAAEIEDMEVAFGEADPFEELEEFILFLLRTAQADHAPAAADPDTLLEVQANVKQEVKQEVNVDDKGVNGKQEVSVKDEVEAETETLAGAFMDTFASDAWYRIIGIGGCVLLVRPRFWILD